MKRILFAALAIVMILSTFCTTAFALTGDDIETGLIPIDPNPDNPGATPTLTFIEVPTKKVYYVGEEKLDLTGMVLRYSDSKGEKNVKIEEIDLETMVEGFDTDSPAEEVVVTIKYEGLTATFTISVIERPPYVPGDVDDNGEVNSDDAIFLLFSSLFGDEGYPLNQPADFDGSGTVDSDDAIYLLFHVLFGGDGYPLEA